MYEKTIPCRQTKGHFLFGGGGGEGEGEGWLEPK